MSVGPRSETRTGTVSDWHVWSRAEGDVLGLVDVRDRQELRGVALRVAAASARVEQLSVRLAAIQSISAEEEGRFIENAVVSFGLMAIGAVIVMVTLLWTAWRFLVSPSTA